MSANNDVSTSFRELNLIEPVLEALDDVGYETPSPIQAATIPPLLAGKDVLGTAQTGTGKTAAFALPLLSRIDLKKLVPQVLVLAPTRELAIQVAEAFQRYAAKMKGFHIVPIYGGQDHRRQVQLLQRGVHVVVGTPGRVMDHMRRGTLKLDGLTALVLDEADEMLRMGFIDDVEWVLEQTPKNRQIALFSATMPTVIRRIAQTHLNNPEEITIKVKTTTASTIRQRFWMVSGLHKLDALSRILEAEPFEAMIIFVRTKTATTELAAKLEARGYATAALNGDIAQNLRERTIGELKSGKIDILVATDVAARGLDVERISHVVNYDIPYDTEAYVHRIGRTGRAGRKGDAILFVAPRERRLLAAIEKATRQKIEPMELPSTEIINDKRIADFKQHISDTLATEELGFYYQLLEQYQHEHNIPALEIAAALAKLLRGDEPLLLAPPKPERAGKSERYERGEPREKRPERGAPRDRGGRDSRRNDADMQRYRIEVGNAHGVKPGNIVGAIANEAGIDSQYIGHIKIHDDYSTVDLPSDLSEDKIRLLRKVWVASQPLNISRLDDKPGRGAKGEFRDKPARKPRPEYDSKSERKPRTVKKKAAAKKKKTKEKPARKGKVKKA
ncbi:MAG: DEAD/DEAH box helicase [Gammaproteobacteria bacterium]